MVEHGLARQDSDGIVVLATSLLGLQLIQGDVAAAFQTQECHDCGTVQEGAG